MQQTDTRAATHSIEVQRLAAGVLSLRLAGEWRIAHGLPSADPVVNALDEAPPARLIVSAEGLAGWDSSLLTFLLDVHAACSDRRIPCDFAALPEGVRRLLVLATTVPERDDAKRQAEAPPFFDRLGILSLAMWRYTGEALTFLGECTYSFGRLLRGRCRFRRSDLGLFIQQSGAQALPIVSLIAILIGMILAFVGAVQLRLFGAQAYVANLVGIAMLREMGAMMTAIIMAGRTGAAFAAQLGTMQVNEEVDALRTFGVIPMDYLVMPRMLALILMMPLLCIYADFLGIFGGFLVGTGMLDLSPAQYIEQTLRWLKFKDLMLGIGKSVIFGVIIASCGCYAGIQSGRSAAAVGEATTRAVVTAIVWIIVADGIFAVVTNVLRI